jgi:glycosyltransferase involved in cell wall biosynthesis
MRIAFLAPRMHVQGPLPKLTPVLAEALRRRGCDVEVLPWGRGFEGEHLRAKFVGRMRDVLTARRAIVHGRFELVVVHTAHDWLTLTRDLVVTRALAGGSRVLVLHFHGSKSPLLLARGSWFFKRATAALLSTVDGLLVLSREEQEEWERFRPGVRVFVVRNPLPNAPADGPVRGAVRAGPPTILCVARLIEGKGVLELVQALSIVRRTTPCRLVLAGDGPEAERIRALAQRLGVSDSVELTGYVVGEDLAGLYRTADVFALPTSLSEGFPMVIQEALAFGLPIVTTRARGQGHHLKDGANAVFVPARDAEALAAQILRLLNDPELRTSMSEANLTKAREFEPDAVGEEYLTALERIAVDKHPEKRRDHYGPEAAHQTRNESSERA